MAASRLLCALLAGWSLLLGGCTSLLGDFKYDPNGSNSGGSAGGTSITNRA
jgi:hypothetical protein